MNKLVTAVKPNGQKDEKLEPREPVGPSRGGSGSRFHYPGGSRPLDGFTIKRGVGHGGFGEVYYATSDGGKEVALKLIRRNLEIELRGVRHCLNLKHPNLLSIFDIREDDQGDKWVVMEYVAGDCLEDVVAAHESGMPAEEALAWLHGIVAGVAYLHDHGVVHRDLKPGNIFSDEGLVKIGDYGLSKFISCSRRSGQTESIGTVHYMAPEVANGRYGKEIDVYAMGVILYEMLTGRVPFEGESVGEVLMKHLTATPDVSMLAEPYRSVVARALEKDPEKRFPSAGELMAALPQPVRAEVHVGPMPSGGGSSRPEAYATAMPAADATNEEPIFRAVRQFFRNIHNWWQTSNLNTPMKVILMILAVAAFAQTAHVLLPLTVAYAIYWVIRSVVLANQGSPAAGAHHPAGPPPMPAAAAASPSVRPAARCVGSRESRLPRWARQEKARDALVMKPLRERLTELVGSMLAGALVAVTMCLVMGLVVSLGSDEPFSSDAYSQYGWLIVMSVITTWAVLLPTKFWEGSRGDAKLRRFVLLPVGLALGLIAAGTASLLVVDLPHDAGFPSLAVGEITGLEPLPLYAEAAWSNMKNYLVAFGLLLLTIRWWLQTDPLRSSRLSLWGMFVCAFMAALVADGCGFPQPWLVMLACAVSASLQLSSPWIHPQKRA